MPGVSAEQVKLAKTVDLLTYLQTNEPQELLRSGANEYRMVSHGSLVISNGLWVWNKGSISGKTALDYLIHVRGMGFVAAVETVLGAAGAYAISSSLPVERPNPPPKELIMPKVSRYGSAAINYLQKRGISAEVLSRCIQEGLLYEGRYNGSSVCVFVGRDESGKERFACMRGIRTDLKQDCSGSNKKYSFCLQAKKTDSRHLIVFEAPIDALSHATLQQRNGWEWDGFRLSLGGTSDTALTAFLERNLQITRIILHLDNDAAGLTAARKIKNRLAGDKRFRHIKISVNPPHRGAKDYNEVLLHDINQEREQKHERRREAAVLL